MEKRDLYDSNKQKTGKIICRGEDIPEGYYIIVVLTMIQNSKGEFLIQKRSKRKGGKYGGTGGHAKTGENGLDAAITEIKEEIGLDVDKDEMILLFQGREDEQQVFYELYYLKRDFEIEDLILQEDEVESVEWMSIGKIEELIKNGEFLENHAEEVYRALELLKDI